MARHKGFSAINIAGLTLGLSACLLIGLFVQDEKKFDKWVPDGDRIYRMYIDRKTAESRERMAGTVPMFATSLQQEFPEVEKTVRIFYIQSKDLFEAGEKKFYEEAGFAPDSTFFEFFPLEFIHGSSSKVLQNPTDIVLSQTMSERFFGKDNPVGKEILYNKTPYVVKGVYRNNPALHLQPNFVIAMRALGIPEKRFESWGWEQLFTYVKLKKGTDITAFELKYQDYIKNTVAPTLKDDDIDYVPYFQPLHKVHLYSADIKFELATVRGNITYVNALSVIALFILLIACFNFVNLATAKSLQRAREVGVRKTIGASRRQLVTHFIGETVLLSFISVLLSVVLALILLPWLNDFTEKNISWQLFIHPLFILGTLAMAIVVGILAGFYPALVLSGFQPVKVLKGNPSGDIAPGRVPWLRHGLVVVQFSLSVLLIICAIVVIRQVNYLHNKDLGLDKEQVMFFPMRGDKMFTEYARFKEQLVQVPGVSSASIGYGFPGDIFAGDAVIIPKNGNTKPTGSTHLMVDGDYVRTMGLKIVAGRDFLKNNGLDTTESFLINETAVREFGFETAEKALGQPIHWPTWRNQDSLKKGRVIGVVKDFNYKSLYDHIEPAVIHFYPDANWKVAVKIKTANAANSINGIKTVWNRFSPEYPIEYNFLDENFEKMYQSEDKLKSLLWIFTAITIFVACLGLFGLAAYAAERRRKEIGIRKVLGATVQGVVVLLSKDFVKLVLISLVIASPIAWYFMNDWLQDFAYRVTISWWIFVAAGIVAVFIALVTVSFQAIKAALSNPVRNLRTE